ncbi:high mobility group B protein 13 isoform X2 [Vitis riparia]|uniref:high mobility group B protein 13 isoform X2 n=1 Tax=Vitis riparia TaxID=96939 RepID=UPI00155A099A|nr:high mobility group B protein 13 isoform X2 [Vitis riparia]
MPTARFPVAGTQKLRTKIGRKPLRPRNISADLDSVQIKAKPEWIDISRVADSNKENHPVYATPVKMESFDASLAEELSAVRKRRERLKIEGDKVEKMLRERDLVMGMWMKEVKQRGEEQKKLEMEVDRLYRLKELRSAVRISPIRPLREREREKKIDAAQSQASPFRRRSVLFLKPSTDESTSPSPSQSLSLGLDRSKSTWPSPSPSPSPSLSLDSSEIGKEK